MSPAGRAKLRVAGHGLDDLDGETTARGIPRDEETLGWDPAFGEGRKDRGRVFESGWERKLRGEPVVRHEHRGPGLTAEVGGEVGVHGG